MTTSPPTSPADGAVDARARGRRRVLIAAGTAAAALAAVYLGLVAATGDAVPPGTTVLGVDVGGRSEAEAAAALEAALGERAGATMDVLVGTEHVSVVPHDAGLRFDARATVAGLAGRLWNPVTLAAAVVGGGRALDPAVVVDDALLAATVTALAADSDVPAVEPGITLDGTRASLAPGRNGTVLDRTAAARALADGYLVSSDPVVLPVTQSTPSVSAEAAQRALVLARHVVSAPVTVRVGTARATVPPATLGRALSFTAGGGELVPSLDGDVLRSAVAPALAAVETPGRDASFAIVAGRPVVVPSKVGRGVNPDLLAKDVLAALSTGGGATRTVDAEIGTIQPKLTTAQARALGVTEQLSSFTQRFPYAAYRVQNIGTAAERVDGTLLLPGQTFSLNDTIGERTPGNGYTKGFVIGPGGVFKEDLGGGVSTSATTIWTAAFYAGLQRVQTQAHSIWIPRYRAGLEATVAWGSFDMKFRNDTPHGVYITTIMRNTSLTVQMWGTKVYDEVRAVSSARYDVTPPSATRYDPTPTCHAQSGEPGFTIDVYRVFVKGGAEVRREKITTRYRPSPTVVCKPDPASLSPSPSPAPTTSPTATSSRPASPTPSPAASAS